MTPHRLPAFLFVTVLGTLLLFAANLDAQSSATLSGTIVDPAGGAIPETKVIATTAEQPGENSSQQPYQASSSSDGRYQLVLPAGSYRIHVTHDSFAAIDQEIRVATGETKNLDFTLHLETMSSSVIVTASAEPELATSSSTETTVLTHEDIEQRDAIWLANILESTPGVTIARLGPFGGVTSLFLDGGNSNFTKVLLDGTPVNDPGGSLDFSNYSLDDVDKIEIVHGASSALYGSDAMTGVIQIFSHRGSTETPELELLSDGGTFGTRHGLARVSGLWRRFDYSTSSSYFFTDGQGPNDRFRDTNLDGNFGYRVSDTDSLRLTVHSMASDAGEPGQTLLVPANLVQNDDLKNIFLNFSWDFSTGSHWQHHLAASESDIREDYEAPGSYIDINQYNRADFEEQSTYLFPHGGFSFGYVYDVENGSAAGPHERRNNQGGYAELRYQLGQRWTATAGTRAEDNASFGTRVVPRAGIAYAARFGHDFWGATRLRASYGEGIKEPTFVQSFDNDPCDPGNPNLQPERTDTFNAGVDQYLASDRLKVAVNYFHDSLYDVVSFYSGGPVTALCPYGTGTYFNTDKSRAYGAQSNFEAKPLQWLRIAGNYTYDNSRVIDAPNYYDPTQAPGNRLFLRPLHSANLVANAGFRRMNWTLIGTYVGRRTDSDFLGLGYTSVASYVRWDAATSYNFTRNFTFIGRIENIFDRRYQDAVGYPALGLNFRLGLKFLWGGEAGARQTP